MKRCNYETTPYTGTGDDPPTCGAPATHGSLCEQHYKWEKQEELRQLQSDPVLVAACAVADGWLDMKTGMNEDDWQAFYSIVPGDYQLKLDALEFATSNGPLRKGKQS